jgi:hypothetical protein
MKRAMIILIALVLFGIAGGALAFKAKKFTLNPVYVSTETIFSQVGGTLFYATTDPLVGAFCSTVPIIYFTTNPSFAITVEAYRTTLTPLRTVTFTSVGGTSTITRAVPACVATTTLAATVI